MSLNSACMFTLLHDAINEKMRGIFHHKVCWLHNHTTVHTASVAKAAAKDGDFEKIDHTPYRPDLAHSNYYRFPKLQKDLRGKKFAVDNEVNNTVCRHFKDKVSDYFLMGV